MVTTRRPGLLADTLRMALDNVRSHRLRSALTIFGVVIGVLVVVVVASILTGMRRQRDRGGRGVRHQQHLRVPPDDRAPARAARPRRVPQEASASRGRRRDPRAGRRGRGRGATPRSSGMPDRTIAYGHEQYRRATCRRCPPTTRAVTNLNLREGRFYHRGGRPAPAQRDGDRPERGRGAVRPRGPRRRAREVTFAGRPFTVIGVLEKRKGGFMGENEDDNVVLMPYRTGRIVAPTASDWMMLVIRARSGQLQAALDQTEEVLRRRRRRARERAVQLRPLDRRPDDLAVRQHHRRHRADRDRHLERRACWWAASA